MKVILYARFSPRPDAATCDSCEKQIADLQEYCRAKSHEVMAEYHDDALSGADDDRPGLIAALGDLRRGWAILVRSIDRLSRDNLMTEMYLREIAMRGAHLLTMDGVGVVHESAEQGLVRVIFQAMAEYQRRKIRETTSRRMRQHQTAGRRMSHRLPYGWEYDPTSPPGPTGQPTHMRPCNAEQDIIQEMLEMYEGGHALRTIARTMNDRGIACRGGRWCHSTIRRILRRTGVPPMNEGTAPQPIQQNQV